MYNVLLTLLRGRCSWRSYCLLFCQVSCLVQVVPAACLSQRHQPCEMCRNLQKVHQPSHQRSRRLKLDQTRGRSCEGGGRPLEKYRKDQGGLQTPDSSAVSSRQVQTRRTSQIPQVRLVCCWMILDGCTPQAAVFSYFYIKL